MHSKIQTCDAQVLEAEQMMLQGLYEDALAALTDCRKNLVGSTDTQSKIRVYQQLAKCLCEVGRYRESLIKIKTAIRLAHRIDDWASYAELKLDLGRILSRVGRFREAEQEFNESYVFFRSSGDHKSMMYPLNYLAQIHYLTGNLRRSCEVIELSVECARKFHSQRDVDIDRRNMARILMYIGDFSRAESIIENIVADDTDLSASANLLLLKGKLRLYRLELPFARHAISSALSTFVSIKSNRDIDVCREYLGLLNYEDGNYAKAREYYQQVLDMPEPTASAVAQTLRMLTDVDIAEEKFDIAEKTAAKAGAAITKINERIELGALWRAYGQIYTHKKETDTARDYFKKSIDLLREIGARYELALSYFAAGKSESYSFDERLRHLEMSRMLFIEMDVPKRVEQVENAITQLRRDANVSAASRKADQAAPIIITGNRQMKEILSAVERIKDTSHTVLITGETGTGKDLLAEYIHRSSTRADKPFRIVNTAAIPSELLESELFGFRKGTYTGAAYDKVGLIESAEGGTFYFDEIGDAPPDVQTKILRVLDTKSVRRLGTTSDIKVNVRFVAATNLDLMQMMEEGCFRSDLYYRLQEMPIHLPPLRNRLDDIRLLVEFFLQGTGFDNATTDNGSFDVLLERLNNHSWPGNIRELKFEINRMIALAPGNNIDDLLKVPSAIGNTDESIDKVTIEREQLVDALRRADGNQSKAARELGIPESTLRYHMKKLDI
ncbi:MAG: sigma 54-interacting transcriptional regulator [candidate division Zixibacteria bacterium]|nr:sigma 54-interacting transcriptional regulator [candidate division Zixibacteria bacterium]MBU1471999.1 sigma 54-interacting transcriptional regulator [candidate division Zixibacteria bacterium]MBU2626523.1 sigma 54-interacting transcriptional regulator [candidate division Zixibacteria bacterium]